MVGLDMIVRIFIIYISPLFFINVFTLLIFSFVSMVVITGKNDGFVDALPTTNVLGRYINDPIGPSGSVNEERCNVKFSHIQQPGIWHCPVIALRDIEEGEELFISYGPRYWAESRMIGG